MFSSLSLFKAVACPDGPDGCSRPACVFAHRPAAELPTARLSIPIRSARPTPQTLPQPPSPAVPAKRPRPPDPTDPPAKVQKRASAATATASSASTTPAPGPPVLRVNASLSRVPLPVRQAMLNNLYDHFRVLYNALIPTDPSLPAKHALKQEEEIYEKSSKLTYRNAAIQCCAVIKRRPLPTHLAHFSVGTEAELAQLAARAESCKILSSVTLTRTDLEPLLLSTDDLVKWGYFTVVPTTSGGNVPSLIGQIAQCDRCGQPFQVASPTPSDAKKCLYHWGKPRTTRASGERIRVYHCCSRSVDSPDGCTYGPHVFNESAIEDLHSRHPFSRLLPSDPLAPQTILAVAALDCEMIYTTGGMRVARVSLVDGAGKEVFDEVVQMDPDVEVIDYITRFSGITSENHAKATRSLVAIRKFLDAYINADTILIGHALDNDLKTLRIIHDNCVDTAILFPHKAGPPYRRALRDLAREHLGSVIQAGDGSTGHSSLEDALATLNLVRWYVQSGSKPLPTSVSGVTSIANN